MTEQNLYNQLWQKYLRVIAMQLKNAVNGERKIELYKYDFDSLGSRKGFDYTFNLEIKNGKVNNNISGKPVARDLFEMLIRDLKTKELLQDKAVRMNLGKEYILRISII